MRTLTAGQQTALQANHVTGCHLVRIQFASGTVYLTDAPFNITWAGNTYFGAGRAGSIQSTRETVGGEATGLRFSLAGSLSSFVATALSEHVQGRAVDLYVAWFDGNQQLIGDPVLEWRGLTDVMPISETPQDDGSVQSVISVSAESRFAQFARARVRRHSDQDQQAANAGDLFFQYAAAMMDRSIVWPNKEWFKRYT